MQLIRQLADSVQTESLGEALADTLTDERAVVFLRGGLGAGKSTLARALLRRLGVQGAIRSPTYTLIERYPLPAGEAVHLDLYRIADAAELDFLGLDELEAEARLWLVEWPERGAGALPAPDLELTLMVGNDGGREVTLDAHTDMGQQWLRRLAGHEQFHPVAGHSC